MLQISGQCDSEMIRYRVCASGSGVTLSTYVRWSVSCNASHITLPEYVGKCFCIQHVIKQLINHLGDMLNTTCLLSTKLRQLSYHSNSRNTAYSFLVNFRRSPSLKVQTRFSQRKNGLRTAIHECHVYLFKMA